MVSYRNRSFRIICVFLFPLLACAQKNDTIYLMNGDRITGELKKYESGLLTLKTEGISTINIEWDKISTMYSSKYFEIVKKTGFSYFGSIIKSKNKGFIGIGISNDTVPEPISDVVEITPIKSIFWKKFSGSIDLGLSYYKSTNTLQYYFDGVVNYRGRKDLFTLGLNMMISNQKISDTIIKSNKNDIGLDYYHFFQGRWWGGLGTKYQQNTELDLDYRYQLGLGAGYDFVHTNPIRFYAMGGLLVNREKPTDSVSSSTNFEGLIAAKFTWLKYRHPKVDISTDINFFPSLSVKNRYRMESNLSAKYEVFRDFFLGLAYYDNYDSKPSGGGPALNDWSVVFTIGYSF
jgi:hypothetical protein